MPLTKHLLPHQLDGIRFVWENVVQALRYLRDEALEETRLQGRRLAIRAGSNGCGCILAHSMGLGKTLQVISATKLLLHHPQVQKRGKSTLLKNQKPQVHVLFQHCNS